MKLLIVSDIHGNWPALRTVLETESDADQVLCLGDLVNFGPQPAECVAWAKEMVQPEWMIQGNHDRAVVFSEPSHCSLLYEGLADATQEISEHLLTQDMKDFLRDRHPLNRFALGNEKCVACHAIPKDPLYGILPQTAASTLWESEIVTAGLPNFLFLGHTHLPMKMRVTKTLIVNPGSVGLPLHGNANAAYAIWQDGDVTLRSTPYDVEETIRAYLESGLSPLIVRQLADILRTGHGISLEHSASAGAAFSPR